MTIRVGINGFGRIGRLALREAWQRLDIEFVHINDVGGDAESAAHLVNFDTVHGTWDHNCQAVDGKLEIDGKQIGWGSEPSLSAAPWGELGVDVVLECTGKFRSVDKLQAYLDAGVPRVVVSAPVKSPQVANIVMGVNEHIYDADLHRIVTAASCTTNCLAPVLAVMKEAFGLRHGIITTIHAVTATQNVLDNFHKDLRRARSAHQSLIPTSTGSAAAIIEIFPELKGRIDGLAIRVPMATTSLTDCVFELEKSVDVAAVNAALAEAAAGSLQGILGYEERPLVSVDYTNDRRSSIVDALSTMVVNDTQVKILAWYDNEIGYVNRLLELALKVAGQPLQRGTGTA